MYDHILVPTDGSVHTEPAVEYALAIANRYDSTVHALHVVDSSPIERKLELTALDTDEETLPDAWHAAGDDATQHVADRASEHVQTVTEVRRGIPAREIASYVDDKGIDLVSMGTRGHTGLDRLLLGSVTTRVVRTLDVPVLCVNAGESGSETISQPITFDNILVPTDGSKPALAAVRRGLDLARTYGATLHGLYVVDQRAYAARPGSTWHALQQALEETGETVLQEVEAMADRDNVTAVTEFRHGMPHQAIGEYTADRDVDLVVIGTHGRSGLSRHIIGSVTERVLRRSAVPVLTTRTG